jgi:hypothetical protein
MTEKDIFRLHAAITDHPPDVEELIRQRDNLLVLALAVAEYFQDTDAPLGKMARELIAESGRK